MSPGAAGPPDVTVVVVAYEARRRIAVCLEALRAQALEGARMEVVVVDNASKDGTADLVAEHFPEVELLRCATNHGFAGGNNVALRRVRSAWVVLLNDDAAPEPDFVAELLRAARSAPATVGAVSATVLLDQAYRPARESDPSGAVVTGAVGRYVQDDAGDVVLVNSTGSVVRVDGYGVDRGWLDEWGRVPYATDVFSFSGAAAALRRSALDQVGLFDESFFMYYEDTDLAWRMRLGGWSVRYCATAVVRHQHAASSREGSEFFRFHDQRNRLLTLVKDATASRALRAVLRYLVTLASVTLRRREPWRLVRVRLRVLLSFTRLLPRTLAERARVGRSARIRRRDVDALLAPVGTVVGPLRPTDGVA